MPSCPVKKSKYVFTPKKRRGSAPTQLAKAIIKHPNNYPNIRKTLANITCTNVHNVSYYQAGKDKIIKQLYRKYGMRTHINLENATDKSARVLKAGARMEFHQGYLPGTKVLVLYEYIYDTPLRKLGEYRYGLEYQGYPLSLSLSPITIPYLNRFLSLTYLTY